MKILRIIARLNVGGPARHVVWLTERLHDDEFQSRLVAGTVPPGEEDMSYFAAEHGVEPVYVAELSRELSPKDIISLWRVYREMCTFQPDIVHTHTAKAGTIGRIAAFLYKWFTLGTLMGRPRRVKVVHTFHGHVFHSYYGKAKTQIFLLIERVLARFATDRIIVISEQQLKEIHERFGVGRREQFQVVPLGLDLGQFENSVDTRIAFRNEIGAGDDETVVGFVGRLTAIKNLPLLIDAAETVINDPAARPTRFVIIGDGELRGPLEHEVAARGLKEKIQFLGNRPDVAKLLPGLDIIALTSDNEGTPLSLIEAMACGVPFVSTAVGGVVDLAGNLIEQKPDFGICERGILCDPGSATSLSRGLLYLAKDERLSDAISRTGKQFVFERYSVDRLVDDVKQLYRQIGPSQADTVS